MATSDFLLMALLVCLAALPVIALTALWETRAEKLEWHDAPMCWRCGSRYFCLHR